MEGGGKMIGGNGDGVDRLEIGAWGTDLRRSYQSFSYQQRREEKVKKAV